MASERVIPIFPLPIVACPSELVPLHIFEPRYRELVAWARGQQELGLGGDFGIFLHDGVNVRATGTMVRIVKLLKEYEDGRSDLLAVGQGRCRIVELLKLHAYDSARVVLVEDDEDDWDDKAATEAFMLHRSLLTAVTGKVPEDRIYTGRRSLSFHLAASAGLSIEDKQNLLEMRSETERLTSLVRHMESLIARIESVKKAAQSIQHGWALQEIMRSG